MSESKELEDKKMIRKVILEGGPEDRASLNDWLKKNNWKQTGEFTFPDEEYEKMVEWALDDETEDNKAYDAAYLKECQRIAIEQNKVTRKPAQAQETKMDKIKRETSIEAPLLPSTLSI